MARRVIAAAVVPGGPPSFRHPAEHVGFLHVHVEHHRRARGGEGLLDVLAVRVRRARDALAVERRDEEVRSVAVEERGEREREREVTLADEEDAHAAVVAVR